MIGCYDIWVMFSYVGLMFGVLSVYFSGVGNYKISLFFMMLAALIDMYDGRFARRFDRTDVEKKFGIEIDSILDTVNFGVIPVFFCMNMGLTEWYCYIVYFMYFMATTMRLAYFNASMVEFKNFCDKYDLYMGLPVTMSPIVVAIGYIVARLAYRESIMLLALAITAILFVSNIKIKRYKNKWFNGGLILFGLVIFSLVVIL